VRDPAAVDDAVAAVFSVTAPAGLSTSEALVEFLCGKQLLLVLDNCEHLLEAVAVLAGVLQRWCQRLVILATSREGLGIEGERLVPVPPLGVPGADADLTAISQAEAVRLFAERAAAVKPDFVVSAENAAAVAAVVWRLDGIALAIELAAARIAAMTPSELARRLERSFAVLGAGRRGAVAHHQTLRATIDWSYQLLAEPEQRLLARLSVFAGGCTLDAAETVCGGDGIDPDTGVRAAGAPGGAVTGSNRRTRTRDPLPAAGDDPPIRGGTPNRDRRNRPVAGPTRRLLRGLPPPSPASRPARRGVLGGEAQRRTRQPGRGLVLGDRHTQY
jgi:predicted ATPase